MNYNSRLGNSLHKTIGLDKILRQCAITKNSEKFLSKRLFWFYAANTIVIHSLFVHIFLIPTTRYRVAWYEMRDMHTKLGTVPLFAYYPTQVQDSCICVYAVESMRAQLYRIFFRFYFKKQIYQIFLAFCNIQRVSILMPRFNIFLKDGCLYFLLFRNEIFTRFSLLF